MTGEVVDLEADLRRLLDVGVERAGLPAERTARALRAAAFLVAHEDRLRSLGLLCLGERRADLHLAPALGEALARALE